MFKQILVAIDMSPASTRGLNTAVALAKDQKAGLHVLHVFDEQALPPDIADGTYLPASYNKMKKDNARESARSFLDNATATAVKEGIEVHSILLEMSGHDIAHSILAQAQQVNADVIVLGTHGRRGLQRIVMGSDAENVVRESRVPVLLVRAEEPEKAAMSLKAATMSLAGAIASASREPADPQPHA